jgi:integrase
MFSPDHSSDGVHSRPDGFPSPNLTQRLTAALKAVRHLRGDGVWCFLDGSPITRDRVIKAVRGARRVAGIEQGVHILRHTFCSAFAAAPLRRTRRTWR